MCIGETTLTVTHFLHGNLDLVQPHPAIMVLQVRFVIARDDFEIITSDTFLESSVQLVPSMQGDLLCNQLPHGNIAKQGKTPQRAIANSSRIYW